MFSADSDAVHLSAERTVCTLEQLDSLQLLPRAQKHLYLLGEVKREESMGITDYSLALFIALK